MNILPRPQVDAAIVRWNERERWRQRNLRLIQEGRPLEADAPIRVEKFLARRGFSPSDTFELMRREHTDRPEDAEATEGQFEPDALERVLGTNDLVGRAFIDLCLEKGRTVGRIWMGVTEGRPRGYATGFLISPRLLMTNHHVLGDPMIARTSLVEMNYEIGSAGAEPTQAFSLDVDSFFAADEHLDYAVVAVHGTSSNGAPLAPYGWNRLIEEEGKTIVSQWVNIIQHPNAEPKQYGLRENQVVDVLPEFLHYKTDTAPGSSGSPVFNDRWEVVALHHSGIWRKNDAGQVMAVDGRVWRPEMGDSKIDWIANEGVRVSKILAHIRSQSMTERAKRLFDEIFAAAPEAAPRIPDAVGIRDTRSNNLTRKAMSSLINIRIESDGEITISVKPTPSESPVPLLKQTAGVTVSPPSPQVAQVSDTRETILAAARSEFQSRTDVLGVRWGYVFKDGWITKDPALVVTVRRKRSLSDLREAGISPLPDVYRNFPIEVTGPTPEELIAVERGMAAESLVAPAAVTPEEITYVPPANGALTKIANGVMRVIAHVSPDAGWGQLSAFLAATRRRLVVGMFDFGAPHILDAAETACRRQGFRKFTLAIQPGESLGDGTKADDLADADVVKRLGNQLHNKFEYAWVKIGRVNGWVASSYHIKVAVRDSTAFWLSSGNWQSSNQPAADPLGENPQRAKWLQEYNREWHAVVEHEGLAKTYEAFLENDFANNRDNDPNEALAMPGLLLPELLVLPEALEQISNVRYFPPFDETREFTVMPLLTPDNYLDEVVALVQSANDELLIQNQTFNAPGDNQDALNRLMTAIRERQQAGVRVRIIFRYIIPAKVRKNLEALQDFGFDMASIRVQPNCHTKGIIVDRAKVLLGSQNLSNDGVSVNRDASLLFEDPSLARYFAEIFDYDWANLTRQNIGNESLPLELAPADGVTPDGLIRLSWKDYLELM